MCYDNDSIDTNSDINNPEIVKILKNAYNYYQDAATNYAKVSTTLPDGIM